MNLTCYKGMKTKKEREREKGEKGKEGRKAGREKKKKCSPAEKSRTPRTTYWKGLVLQMVTAGKSIALKPMERETLTSQLR